MSGVTSNFTLRNNNTGVCDNPLGIVLQFCYTDELDEEQPEDLTDIDVVLVTPLTNGQRFYKSTDAGDGTVELSSATVTFPISVEDSNLVLGRNTLDYSVKFVTATSDRTRVSGTLTFLESNDDGG